MLISKEARAVRKKAQVARLAAKADEDTDYPKFYAEQPLQLARAEVNDRIRETRSLIRKAGKQLEIALASGINIEVAESAVRNAQAARVGLEALKRARFKPSSTLTLKAGGA